VEERQYLRLDRRKDPHEYGRSQKKVTFS